MATSIALFDCPHCVDEFAFDYQKIAYTVIHNCDPNKYQAGEIVEILPPDPKASPEWRMAVNTLRMQILQKKTGWQPQG